MTLFLRVARRAFWLFCRILPVQKNKIVFQSYYGRGYGDNPKYIAEQLPKDKLKFVWVTNGKEPPDTPEYFKTVRFRGFRYIYEMSTAKIWVDNSRKAYCMKKKNQYYMQTWHAGFTIKKVEKAAEDRLEENYVRQAKLDAKMTDVMLSNCARLSESYRKDFWYREDGEILECGLPRNDRLFHFTEEDARRIREKVGVAEDEHCLLYAPTFRSTGDLSPYDLDFAGCCEALEKRFGGKWKILLRLHPNIFLKSTEIKPDERYVINASFHPDVQELYLISDLLITDYSTVIFDFFLLDRPAFFYANDIEYYTGDRGFEVSLYDLPFPLATKNEEMIRILSEFDRDEYDRKIAGFRKRQPFYDNGHAAEKAAEWIMDRINRG